MLVGRICNGSPEESGVLEGERLGMAEWGGASGCASGREDGLEGCRGQISAWGLREADRVGSGMGEGSRR